MPAFRELLGKAVFDQFVVLVIDGEARGIYCIIILINTEVRMSLYLDPVLADLFLERKGTSITTSIGSSFAMTYPSGAFVSLR